MSVNLGNDAVTAMVELRGNHHAERLVTALGEFSQKMMLAALDADVDNRVDKTGYARGMYHVWQALDAAYYGKHMAQVKPPALPSARTKVNADV